MSVELRDVTSSKFEKVWKRLDIRGFQPVDSGIQILEYAVLASVDILNRPGADCREVQSATKVFLISTIMVETSILISIIIVRRSICISTIFVGLSISVSTIDRHVRMHADYTMNIL